MFLPKYVEGKSEFEVQSVNECRDEFLEAERVHIAFVCFYESRLKFVLGFSGLLCQRAGIAESFPDSRVRRELFK